MPVRIVSDGGHVEAIADAFARAAAHWAGGRSETWTIGETHGEGFVRDDDLYLFVERSVEAIAFGAARRDDDRDILRVIFARAAPDARRDDVALAWDDADADAYLLMSLDALARQGVADPLRRLAGAAPVKRADIAGDAFAAIGPLDKPRGAEGLAALARLSCAAARAAGAPLYAPAAARALRLRDRALAEVSGRLAHLGYFAAAAAPAPFGPDIAVQRGGVTLSIAAPRALHPHAVAAAMSAAVVGAPIAGQGVRILAAPAPAQDDGGAFNALRPAFEAMRLSLMFYDLGADGFVLTTPIAHPSLADHLRASAIPEGL
ncbi:MAG: hypothetical protein NW203_04440 [Hyphomonadaceae bacterium]|nr:hypothetical protein [Hyphomonadaceae bacterium]